MNRLTSPFSNTREILIADAGIEGLGTLLEGLNPGVEPWLVQSGENAVAKIIKALATPGLKTLHLLAHGAPGQINLGGHAITAADFTSRFDGAAQRDLDIAFWSCRTGADAAGQDFVQAVANATGARVFATSGLVGHAEKGGSWSLGEAVSPPVDVRARNEFANILAAVAGTVDGNPVVDIADSIVTGDEVVVVTDTSAAAVDLSAIAALLTGTGSIDGSAVTAINGTAAEVVQALTDLDTDPVNFDSALTGT
ncbi:DUF4347 domain-containing protein, partial [Methylomonas sp. SURF-2]